MTGERPQGKTNLMTACEQGRALEAKIILQKKPHSISIKDKHGKTALHYCAESGALACAQLLVGGADRTLLDAPDSEGFTPLHLAVISGHKSIARLLLRAGADPDSVDKERHSAVHWAAVCGDTESLDLLLNHGANPSTPDILGAYPIHYAAQMCGTHNLTGKDPETGLNTLKKLVEKGASIQCRDKDGREPLLWAASAGSSEAVLVLFTAGANISSSDKDGLTALHCAASRGHTACVETLITLCGSKVDSGDHIGCSPLFYAAAQGQADCAQVLLKHGADPNRQDNKGRTPAHCAAVKGRLEILRILDSNGADLWIRNSRGNLPLHEAIVSGRKDLVQWLLQQCPRAVNATNISGRTPLHIAAQRNNVEMCEILIDYGAFINPLMVNAKGFLMTPLDASVYQGNQRCAKYLQLHGAVPATKVLENNEINRNLLFSLGNYAYSQKERSDEEPPSSAVFDPTKGIRKTSNIRDTQTRTIRGGQQPPLPQAEVPPESELTNVISEEAADASVHIHLSRDDLWSLWESLMQELTSELSGSELSQGSDRRQKLSRKTSEVHQLKPILTNVYLRRDSYQSHVIAGESIFDRNVDQDEMLTRSVSEDPRIRYPKRATDDFKATLPRVSEAEKSKSTEEDRNTPSSQISATGVKEKTKDKVKADDDAFNYFTDSVGSDTENVSSITGTKATRLRKRRSDARPWVKELEESETSSANHQERRDGNPYMKRYFQRQARAAEMRKYLEAQNFQHEDEYQTKRDSKKEISEKYDDSQGYGDDDDDHAESTRFPHLDRKEKSKRSRKEDKSPNVSREVLEDEVPSNSKKLYRSKASSVLNLDSIHSPHHTSKKRSKDHKHKICECMKEREGKVKPKNWHSEECHLKKLHGEESPQKSGRRKRGTSSTRDMGRKSSKHFLEVPSQQSAAASDERSEDITQEEERKHRHHYHHYHYHHHHYHRESVTPENEDHYLENYRKNKRHYHRRKSRKRDESYSAGNRTERKTYSDGEYEQFGKDIYSGYDIHRSKSEMSHIPWYGTRDVLTQSPVPEINEKENSETLSNADGLKIISKLEEQELIKEPQSKISKNIADYEQSSNAKKESDNSKRRKSSVKLEKEIEKSPLHISEEKRKINYSKDFQMKNSHNGRSVSALRNGKEKYVKRESKKPGKPPLRPAQSFSGTLSQKTKDIPLKQKSQSARIEKDLPEIKVFSVEGDETNILVRTDFELKDVSEASEFTSNGDTSDKNKTKANMAVDFIQELKNDTEEVISEEKNIDIKRIETSKSDYLEYENVRHVDDGKQVSQDGNFNPEITTGKHSKVEKEDKENRVTVDELEDTKVKAVSALVTDAKISKMKEIDTSEDELNSSNEDEPDEILYRDENYASAIEDNEEESIKIIEESDNNLLTTEIIENAHSVDENMQVEESIEKKSDINNMNLLNDETRKSPEIKQTLDEENDVAGNNSEIKSTSHLNILDRYELETAVSNEENEDKSPNAYLEKEPEKNADENTKIIENKYAEQNETVVEISENINKGQANTHSYGEIYDKGENNDVETDENASDFVKLSNVGERSECKEPKETYENSLKNHSEETSSEMLDIQDMREEKHFQEENLKIEIEREISKQDSERLTDKVKILGGNQSEKLNEKILKLNQEQNVKLTEPKFETQEEELNMQKENNVITKLHQELIAPELSTAIIQKGTKNEDKKKEIELVEETARNQVLSIIQQAQSEIQKQFGINSLKTKDSDLISAKEGLATENGLLQMQNSAINETIDINIIEATPVYDNRQAGDENVYFSEPESASEAETKFNTDSEDTQPEPDLDLELLSEDAQKDDKTDEIRQMEPTPDLVLLAKTLEAETRALATREEEQKNNLDRLPIQNTNHKENSNDYNGKVLKANHAEDREEKQKTNSKISHRLGTVANVKSKEDEITNMHDKHQRKSRDGQNKVSHGKHKRNSKPNHFIDENEKEEEKEKRNKGKKYAENAIIKDSESLNTKDHNRKAKTFHRDIKKNEKEHEIPIDENEKLVEQDGDSLNTDDKIQRKLSVSENFEHHSETFEIVENTTCKENVSTADKKLGSFQSAEVQTDISGETKLSEIGINVEKEIGSHIGFNRSISVQTIDYDVNVATVLEKIQKESENISVSTETHRTISIQTEGSNSGEKPVIDQSEEIKQVIRTANINDISGKSRSLATQSLELPQSTNDNLRKEKSISVAVDATQRSPERQNPSAVFYTAQTKVINESPKKEKQNIGALFYAAPSMNDKYDISSISTPNLYSEQINREKQIIGFRGKIPRSTIRDRSLESERAVAIANTAFRRLNSKGELTVFNSSLVTVPQNAPVSLAESKPTYRKEYSNLEKSGFLWVHFGSGSSPISSLKRRPNLTSQKVKRESKFLPKDVIYRNIDEDKRKNYTAKNPSVRQANRTSEMGDERKSNIYLKNKTGNQTVNEKKSLSTKPKSVLNEALHVTSKVLTNKTSRRSYTQNIEKMLEDNKQNEVRSRIPYKCSDYDINRRSEDIKTQAENKRMYKQNQLESRGKIPEIVKNEHSPRRAIPRLCRENTSTKNSSEQVNTPRDKITKIYENIPDVYHKNELLDDNNEAKNNLEVQCEKTSKGQGNSKLMKEIRDKADFHESNQEECLGEKMYHFDITNSQFENNVSSEVSTNKRNSYGKQACNSNGISIDTLYNDYSLQKSEFDSLIKDQMDSLTHIQDVNKEGTKTKQNPKEMKKKSPKKSSKTSSEKKEKQNLKKNDNNETEANYFETEKKEMLDCMEFEDIENYFECMPEDMEELNQRKLEKHNQKTKVKSLKRERRKTSEIVEDDITENDISDLLNNENCYGKAENDTAKEALLQSPKSPSSKSNEVNIPERTGEDLSRKNDNERKYEERYNQRDKTENKSTKFKSNNGSKSGTPRSKKSQNNNEESPERSRKESSRKNDIPKNRNEDNNHSGKRENSSTSLKPNDDSNHPHPRLSETAKSSSLDEGDVKFVIERKKDPDFSIKISMKDKYNKRRKQKESNTDFSSTQYESDQSYVKDSGYISTTESVHHHRRSITIDLGHTKAKINAGMKNSSTSYDEESDSIRGKITLPDVDKRTEFSINEQRNEQQNPKTPSKTLPSKLPVLNSHRHRSSSVVLATYSRTPRESSTNLDEEADSNNFDSKRKKNLDKRSPVRQVGHGAEKSAEKFTRYGSGIPIYRAQSDSNLQQLGKPSPRFSGQSLSTLSIPEMNDLRNAISEGQMDSMLEHSYSASDIPRSVNRYETSTFDNLKLPSILLSRPEEKDLCGSPLSKKSVQSFSPRRIFGGSSKHTSPISSRVITPDLGYLKLPILQQAVRCKIEPYEYWDGRRTKSAVDCVANLHFLSEEELAQFDQRLLAIGRRASFSSDNVKRRSSPIGYRAISTQTLKRLRCGRKSADSLTFHVDHDRERNSFKLPTEKLKNNKKLKVTFTIGKSKKGKKRKTKEANKSDISDKTK